MEQAKPAQAAEALDSLANTTLDGTATQQTFSSPETAIPQAVMQMLEKEYPSWEEPVLAKNALTSANEHEQGPLIVQGDFNGDTLLDYALQIKYKNSVVALAFLQTPEEWQLYELDKENLIKERGELKSPYNLHLLEAGSSIFNPEKATQTITVHDAPAAGKGNAAKVYVFENGNFKAYQVEE